MDEHASSSVSTEKKILPRGESWSTRFQTTYIWIYLLCKLCGNGSTRERFPAILDLIWDPSRVGTFHSRFSSVIISQMRWKIVSLLSKFYWSDRYKIPFLSRQLWCRHISTILYASYVGQLNQNKTWFSSSMYLNCEHKIISSLPWGPCDPRLQHRGTGQRRRPVQLN